MRPQLEKFQCSYKEIALQLENLTMKGNAALFLMETFMKWRTTWTKEKNQNKLPSSRELLQKWKNRLVTSLRLLSLFKQTIKT